MYRGSPIGFPGYRISLIWRSGFGILKQNREGFGIESMCGRWDAKNNPQDYGIAQNLGSGLQDWKTLLGTLCIESKIYLSQDISWWIQGKKGRTSWQLFSFCWRSASVLARRLSSICFSSCNRRRSYIHLCYHDVSSNYVNTCIEYDRTSWVNDRFIIKQDYKKNLNTSLSLCKQLSHFSRPGPLLTRFSEWFC